MLWRMMLCTLSDDTAAWLHIHVTSKSTRLSEIHLACRLSSIRRPLRLDKGKGTTDSSRPYGQNTRTHHLQHSPYFTSARTKTQDDLEIESWSSFGSTTDPGGRYGSRALSTTSSSLQSNREFQWKHVRNLNVERVPISGVQRHSVLPSSQDHPARTPTRRAKQKA